MKGVFERIVDLLAILNLRLGSLLRGFCTLLLVAMTVIVLVQVLLRYVFNDSLVWSEELAKILMVWTAFLIAPWAYRQGANVSIALFVTVLPNLIRSLLRILIHLLVVWILLVLFQESIAFCARGFEISAATLPVRMGWFYSVVPFALGATLLVAVELLLKDLLQFSNRDELPASDAGMVDS